MPRHGAEQIFSKSPSASKEMSILKPSTFARGKYFSSASSSNFSGSPKTSAAELSELPNGTARGYFKHSDRADILRDAGEADITFSPCSDMLRDTAEKCGLQNFAEESQENFFVKNAEETMRKIAQSPDPFDPRKRELVQLLSPVHMGAAFRVISAVRK